MDSRATSCHPPTISVLGFSTSITVKVKITPCLTVAAIIPYDFRRNIPDWNELIKVHKRTSKSG